MRTDDDMVALLAAVARVSIPVGEALDRIRGTAHQHHLELVSGSEHQPIVCEIAGSVDVPVETAARQGTHLGLVPRPE